MIIYQLWAIGPMAEFADNHTFHSKRVFYSRDDAEHYRPDFEADCTTPRDDRDLRYLLCVTQRGVTELVLE